MKRLTRDRNHFAIWCCVATVCVLESRTCTATNAFSIVVLPDTQVYSELHPETYLAQTTWIRSNLAVRNIKCVLHVGDMVNNDVAAEWDNALAAHKTLDGVVPWIVGLGNHDYKEGRYDLGSMFNDPAYFGPGSPYASQPNIVFHQTNRTDAAYLTFSAGSTRWLALGLPWTPPVSVRTWADRVIGNHSNHSVLVVFHDYLDAGGQARTSNGQQIWETVLKKHSNVAMVFCGHAENESHSHLASRGDTSNTVHQLLSNYQHLRNGGEGWLRILDFSADGYVDVTTYSPLLNASRSEEHHQFSFALTATNARPESHSKADSTPLTLNADINKTPVLYLPLDGTVDDHSQHGNHGVLIGNPTLVDGKFDKGLEFHGPADGIEIQHSNSLNWGDGPVTLEFWIKPYKGFNGGIDKGSGSFYILGAHGLQLRSGKSGAGTLLLSKSKLATNKWSHVAATKDGNRILLYINGKLDAWGHAYRTTVNNKHSMFIGKRSQYTDEGVEGIVDEVRIWPRALKADEISRYMNMDRKEFLQALPEE